MPAATRANKMSKIRPFETIHTINNDELGFVSLSKGFQNRSIENEH